jgi:peptidoglycan/LPS O-acetylase OafA/YrhL
MSDKIQPPSEFSSGQRFALIDALRGIGAVMVLFHHLLFESDLQITLWKALPRWFAEFCHKGAFGVEIFFVLSGFVIVHSLRNVPLTGKGLGNFMLRRQLRLDPPYWAMLGITLASLLIERQVPWIEHRPLPAWYDVLLNMFYVQNLVRGFPIMGVAWTLCLEVQFYIVLIALLVAGKYMSKSRTKSLPCTAALVALLGIASLLVPGHKVDQWFIQWWYYFAAGALCYWAVTNPRFRPALFVFLALMLLPVLYQDPAQVLIGWGTTLLIYVASRKGTLTTWLNFEPLQYLGRISYSLYLCHLLVLIYVMRLGYRLTKTNHAWAIFWFFLAGAASIAAAQILYVLVERNSVQFAARFKPARKEAASPSSSPDGPSQQLAGGVEELQRA